MRSKTTRGKAAATPAESFTLEECARAGRISVDKIRHLIRDGKLRAYRLGVSLRIDPADWAEFIVGEVYTEPLAQLNHRLSPTAREHAASEKAMATQARREQRG